MSDPLYTPRLHRVQELLTFNRVKHQPHEEIRRMMTTSLIMSLRGHHDKGLDLMREAIETERTYRHKGGTTE